MKNEKKKVGRPKLNVLDKKQRYLRNQNLTVNILALQLRLILVALQKMY